MASCVDFIRHSCSFTGHRPSKLPWRYDESSAECIALKASLSSRITALVDAGVIHFLTGMAEGVDCYAASIVLALREQNTAIKLHCILPCVGQDTQWARASQTQYRSILEQADVIRFIRREKTKDCMLARNRFLVQWSSIVVAVYNGEKRGGTAATVRYARKEKREIFILNPETLIWTHENPP